MDGERGKQAKFSSSAARAEEELKGSEVPSWEWCREWLPDVGKLQRGGDGEGRATTPDALMEQGLVWCCGKNPS